MGDKKCNPANSTLTLKQRCQSIELLLLDVDGVITRGGIIYDSTGKELKNFHVRDGSGMVFWKRAGKRSAIISGRSSPVVARRARELGIDLAVQGATDKLAAFREVLQQFDLSPQQACFIGDDLPDLPVLLRCGLAVAVADASAEVRHRVHHITHTSGGFGAVRETIELILGCQSRWDSIVELHTASASLTD